MNPHDSNSFVPSITEVPDYVWASKRDTPKDIGRRIFHPNAEAALQAAKKACRSHPGRWYGRASTGANVAEFLVYEASKSWSVMLWADKCPQLFSKNFIFCIFTRSKAICNGILHIAKMKEEGKTNYEAPAITVVEVKTEGVVCNSPTLEDYIVNRYEEE